MTHWRWLVATTPAIAGPRRRQPSNGYTEGRIYFAAPGNGLSPPALYRRPSRPAQLPRMVPTGAFSVKSDRVMLPLER